MESKESNSDNKPKSRWSKPSERRGENVRRVIAIYGLLAHSEPMTVEQIHRAIDPTSCDRTIRRDLAVLKSLDLVKAIVEKNRHYRWTVRMKK